MMILRVSILGSRYWFQLSTATSSNLILTRSDIQSAELKDAALAFCQMASVCNPYREFVSIGAGLWLKSPKYWVLLVLTDLVYLSSQLHVVLAARCDLIRLQLILLQIPLVYIHYVQANRKHHLLMILMPRVYLICQLQYFYLL